MSGHSGSLRVRPCAFRRAPSFAGAGRVKVAALTNGLWRRWEGGGVGGREPVRWPGLLEEDKEYGERCIKPNQGLCSWTPNTLEGGWGGHPDPSRPEEAWAGLLHHLLHPPHRHPVPCLEGLFQNPDFLERTLSPHQHPLSCTWNLSRKRSLFSLTYN